MLKKFFVHTTVLFTLITCGTALAAELSKSDAEKLLRIMGDESVVVAAVVNGLGAAGLGAVGGTNVATVIGYAERKGKAKEVKQSFMFDNDLGWFYYEVDLKRKRVRLWTADGYKVLRPIKR
ncbi:hypothetical protein ACFL6B_04780 [Thermodesulfobacteriota bacterium]